MEPRNIPLMELKGDLEMYFRNMKQLRNKEKALLNAAKNMTNKRFDQFYNKGLITVSEFTDLQAGICKRYEILNFKLLLEKRDILHLLERLSEYPENKIPPVELYRSLVSLTGERNSWTAEEWIKFLKGE